MLNVHRINRTTSAWTCIYRLSRCTTKSPLRQEMHLHLRSPQELHHHRSSATRHTYLWPPQMIHHKTSPTCKAHPLILRLPQTTLQKKKSSAIPTYPSEASVCRGYTKKKTSSERTKHPSDTPTCKRVHQNKSRQRELTPICLQGYTKAKVLCENKTPI